MSLPIDRQRSRVDSRRSRGRRSRGAGTVAASLAIVVGATGLLLAAVVAPLPGGAGPATAADVASATSTTSLSGAETEGTTPVKPAGVARAQDLCLALRDVRGVRFTGESRDSRPAREAEDDGDARDLLGRP